MTEVVVRVEQRGDGVSIRLREGMGLMSNKISKLIVEILCLHVRYDEQVQAHLVCPFVSHTILFLIFIVLCMYIVACPLWIHLTCLHSAKHNCLCSTAPFTCPHFLTQTHLLHQRTICACCLVGPEPPDEPNEPNNLCTLPGGAGATQ